MATIGGRPTALSWLDNPTDDQLQVLAALSSLHMQEAIPDERPITAEELRVQTAFTPAHRTISRVLALLDEEPIGAAELVVDDLRKEGAGVPLLFVMATHRGRGFGGYLLEAVRERAREAGRVRLRVTTQVGHAAGAAFAQRAGGRRGLVNEHNRCPTAALDRALLRTWIERAGERARGYSLVAFDGVCPLEHLDAFTRATRIMNTAPRAEGTEEIAPTPEQVREDMVACVSQGNQAWTICARDRTGEFVGYTELGLPELRPWVAWQGDTGVHPEHRRRGIGRWLKAENALRLLAERPQVEYIDTHNAAGNAAMLSINRAMGFRPMIRWQEWDIPI